MLRARLPLVRRHDYILPASAPRAAWALPRWVPQSCIGGCPASSAQRTARLRSGAESVRPLRRTRWGGAELAAAALGNLQARPGPLQPPASPSQKEAAQPSWAPSFPAARRKEQRAGPLLALVHLAHRRASTPGRGAPSMRRTWTGSVLSSGTDFNNSSQGGVRVRELGPATQPAAPAPPAGFAALAPIRTRADPAAGSSARSAGQPGAAADHSRLHSSASTGVLSSMPAKTSSWRTRGAAAPEPAGAQRRGARGAGPGPVESVLARWWAGCAVRSSSQLRPKGPCLTRALPVLCRPTGASSGHTSPTSKKAGNSTLPLWRPHVSRPVSRRLITGCGLLAALLVWLLASSAVRPGSREAAAPLPAAAYGSAHQVSSWFLLFLKAFCKSGSGRLGKAHHCRRCSWPRMRMASARRREAGAWRRSTACMACGEPPLSPVSNPASNYNPTGHDSAPGCPLVLEQGPAPAPGLQSGSGAPTMIEFTAPGLFVPLRWGRGKGVEWGQARCPAAWRHADHLAMSPCTGVLLGCWAVLLNKRLQLVSFILVLLAHSKPGVRPELLFSPETTSTRSPIHMPANPPARPPANQPTFPPALFHFYEGTRSA